MSSATPVAPGTGARALIVGATVSPPPPLQLTPHPWAFGWGADTGREDVDERMRGRIDSAAGALPRGVRHSEELQIGAPAPLLLDATRNLDLMVVGSRGYGPARRLLLGSVSGRLVREAHCPVLVVPRPAVPEREPEPRRVSAAARA